MRSRAGFRLSALACSGAGSAGEHKQQPGHGQAGAAAGPEVAQNLQRPAQLQTQHCPVHQPEPAQPGIPVQHVQDQHDVGQQPVAAEPRGELGVVSAVKGCLGAALYIMGCCCVLLASRLAAISASQYHTPGLYLRHASTVEGTGAWLQLQYSHDVSLTSETGTRMHVAGLRCTEPPGV